LSNTILIESQFLPPIQLFSCLKAKPKLVIEAHENYQKKSYRNSCDVLGANGVKRFSVPLGKGKHQQMPIQKVSISYDEDWVDNFVKLCESNYNKSPFIDYILPDIETILNRRSDSLFHLNMEILQWVLNFMEFEVELSCSTSYENPTSAKDMRHVILPQKRQDFQGRNYPQIFSDRFGFVSNLSILDLLFCAGKEAIYYL